MVRDTLDVDLLGKPQALPRRKDDRFRKEDFEIDFGSMKAICPAKETTDDWTWNRAGGTKVPVFVWAKETCQACPLRERCLARDGRNRRLRLHPHEQELREQRERWETPEVREAYRERSQGERHVATMAHHGCRQARAWGLQGAQLQAHAVAITSNLKLLARVLLEDDEG